MISAVDTNVLLDILIPNAKYARRSLECLIRAAEEGSLIIGEMVFAELSSQFTHLGDLTRFLSETAIRLVSSDERSLYEAGCAWRAYTERKSDVFVCPACGKSSRISCLECGESIPTRTHVISDFLIGAHARVFGDRLITRDRGFYRTFFQDLSVFDPSAQSP
jgi:hypothetical protein